MRHATLARRFACLALVTVVAALFALPAAGEEDQDAPGPDTTLWDGYVWRDDEGRMRLGFGVVAMGVMAQPAHVFETDFGRRLAPLASGAGSDYVFWNYALEETDPAEAPGLPRWLIRAEGVERAQGGSASDDPFSEAARGTRTLERARLLQAEHLPDAWLGAWAELFRAHGSPWRIRVDDPPFDEARDLPALAKRLLAAVRAMRQVPGPGEQERKLLASVAPEARLVTSFREAKEHAIVRWLRKVDEEHALGLEGLDALGPVPPDGQTLQRLFLEHADRASFLRALEAAWSGPTEDLVLPHYVREGNRTTWTSTPIDAVAKWSDETYARLRAVTKEMLGS